MGGMSELKNIDLPKEPKRLQIKELAEEVKLRYAKKGLSDVFGLLIYDIRVLYLMRIF